VNTCFITEDDEFPESVEYVGLDNPIVQMCLRYQDFFENEKIKQYLSELLWEEN